jgi:hypothetical protein
MKKMKKIILSIALMICFLTVEAQTITKIEGKRFMRPITEYVDLDSNGIRYPNTGSWHNLSLDFRFEFTNGNIALQQGDTIVISGRVGTQPFLYIDTIILTANLAAGAKIFSVFTDEHMGNYVNALFPFNDSICEGTIVGEVEYVSKYTTIILPSKAAVLQLIKEPAPPPIPPPPVGTPFPDGGFENCWQWFENNMAGKSDYWDFADNYFLNTMNPFYALHPAFGNTPLTAFRLEGSDTYNENYSLKVVSSQMNFAGNTIFLPGVAATLDIDIFGMNLSSGRPFTDRPEAIKGWYQYAPVNGDSAAIEIWLRKNGTILGRGKQVIKNTVSEWTQFNVPVNYTSNETPDTIAVIFSSSANYDFTDLMTLMQCQGQLGSALYLDDISFEYETVIKDSTHARVEIDTVIDCGENYVYNGMIYHQSGVYTHLFYTATGDSVVVINLTVRETFGKIGNIQGTSNITQTGTYTYSIAPLPNAGYYQWTVSNPQWTIINTGAQISLNITEQGTGILSVKAIHTNGQCESDTATLSIGVCNSLGKMGEIQGENLIAQSGKYTYFITPVENAISYQWTVSNPQWNILGSATSTTIDLYINTSSVGTLSVQASDDCGKKSQKDFTVQANVSVLAHKDNSKEIQIYPNPAKDVVFVLIENNALTDVEIHFFDIFGRLLAVQKITNRETTVRMDSFSAGVYVLQIKENREIITTSKIVKTE